jgi:hypothetical protein
MYVCMYVCMYVRACPEGLHPPQALKKSWSPMCARIIDSLLCWYLMPNVINKLCLVSKQ